MMLKKTINNNHGFVMVTVISMVIVMMIIVIGILGRVTTQTLSTDQFIKETQARVLAQGKWWEVHSALVDGTSCASLNGDSGSVTVDGVSYNYAISIADCSAVPLDIDIDVQW